MAVQQNKKTPSKRGMHRSHDFLRNNVAKTVDNKFGELHRRHHLLANGFYRGKKIIDRPVD